jgi:DNA-binding SARP family transcriptional activator
MEVRVLGSTEIAAAGQTIDPGPRKQRLLLCSLVTAPSHLRSAEDLVADVWSDRPPGDPRSGLYTQLSRLRRTLRAATGPGEPVVGVVRTAAGYRLDLAGASIDAACFSDEVGEACRLQTGAVGPVQLELALELLERAMRRWRGPALLDAAAEAFAQPAIAHLNAARRNAEECRIHCLSGTGRTAAAVAAAEELAGRDPLDESAQGLFAVALSRAGRRTEALAALARTRRALADDAGVEPGPALRDLERQLLGGRPALTTRQARPRPPPPPTGQTGARS